MSGEKYSFFDVPEDDISPLFTNKLQEQAHVGCLRGRFQDGGIAVDWFGGNETLCTPEFDAELKDLLKNLCQDGPLDDSQAMRRFCLERPQAKMSGRDTFFAFRIDTSRYRYYLRLFLQKQKFFRIHTAVIQMHCQAGSLNPFLPQLMPRRLRVLHLPPLRSKASQYPFPQEPSGNS